jgi:hypothetical protein
MPGQKIRSGQRTNVTPYPDAQYEEHRGHRDQDVPEQGGAQVRNEQEAEEYREADKPNGNLHGAPDEYGLWGQLVARLEYRSLVLHVTVIEGVKGTGKNGMER